MTDDSDVAITRDEVVALARGLFGEADLPSILTQLDTYGVESHETEVHRVQKAILELSDGKKTRLPYFDLNDCDGIEDFILSYNALK